MPLFFGWLFNLITGAFGFLVAWFGIRAAAVAVTVATYALITVALAACMNGFFSLLGSLPVGGAVDPRAAGALGMFWMGVKACIPDNLTTVIAVCLGADACVFLWRYKMQMVESLSGMR